MVTRHNRCQFGIGDLAQRREREGFSGIHQLFPADGRQIEGGFARGVQAENMGDHFRRLDLFACISATAARISSVLPPEVPT